jgi:uncharacterized membrane protein
MQIPQEIVFAIALFAAVGSAVMGGLLFAFSNFVMKSLTDQPPESGIRTMQAINIQILNPLFLLLFLGTALAVLVLAVHSISRLSEPSATLLLIGSALYLLGTVGVTMAFNVPLNNQLATQNPATPEAHTFWPTYIAGWMLWNHVRTATAILASVLLLLAQKPL